VTRRAASASQGAREIFFIFFARRIEKKFGRFSGFFRRSGFKFNYPIRVNLAGYLLERYM